MKRYFIYAVLISSVLFSCKKENTTPIPTAQNDSKKYDVAFNVTGFSTSQAPFGVFAAIPNKVAAGTQSSSTVTPDSLRKSIAVIYCSITDSKGAVVSIFTQLASDTTFGKLKASLSPGSYHLRIIAGPDRIPVNGTLIFNQSIVPSDDSLNQFLYKNGGNQTSSFGDAFMKMMDITVGNTTGNYNITLDRIVAQVAVNIQDAIPANALYIKVKINDDHYILNVDGTSEGSTGQVVTGGGIINNITTLSSLTPGAKNTKLNSIVLNTQSALTVEITCYDANQNVIADRTINNVTCQPNHITLLTGNLFNNSPDSGIGVSYNTAWNLQTLNYTFN